MLYFRSCPHCKIGTVLLDWDQQGKYFECLNCGWMLDLKQPQAAGVPGPDMDTQGVGTATASVASERAA